MDVFDSAALDSVVTDESIDSDAIDGLLGQHVEGSPKVAVTDGGGMIIAGDDDEILDEDNRPEDCQCWDPDGEFPCWPCYRAGFRSQNSNADTE